MTKEEAQLNAHKIVKTMETDGWKLIRTILDESVAALDTIRGVETVNVAIAQRKALNALEGFVRQLDGIKEAYDASMQAEIPEPDDILTRIRGKRV